MLGIKERTIVDDHTWSCPEFSLDFLEYLRDGVRLGQVDWDVDLVGAGGAVVGTRGQGDAVAFSREGLGDVFADVGTGAEDEEDGRVG